MTQKDLIEKITAVLRASGRTKHIKMQRKVFTITDPNGSSKKFALIEPDHEVLYTTADVANILKAMTEVLVAGVRMGERIRIVGLCSLFARYQDDRVMKDPTTGKLRVIPGHYVAKFKPAQNLRAAALQYAKFLQNQQLDAQEILSTDNRDEYYEDYEEDYEYEEEVLDNLDIEDIDEDDEADFDIESEPDDEESDEFADDDKLDDLDELEELDD